MTEKLNNFETVENVTIHNHGTVPGVPGHVTINISGGTHTHYYGPGGFRPQQEVVENLPDDSQLEQLEDVSEKSDTQPHLVIRSCQKRLSELKQRICTFDDAERPGLEFWVELYGLCEDLEKDLDGVLE